MTKYNLRQGTESYAVKPKLLDEIVASRTSVKYLDDFTSSGEQKRRVMQVEYNGTLEELRQALAGFPEVKIDKTVYAPMPKPPRPKIRGSPASLSQKRKWR